MRYPRLGPLAIALLACALVGCASTATGGVTTSTFTPTASAALSATSSSAVTTTPLATVVPTTTGDPQVLRGQTFSIGGEAMEPTIGASDQVVVDTATHRPIERRDIVVFDRPPKMTNPDVAQIVKRVIGLGGEQVQARDGQVIIDGRALIEPYVPVGSLTSDFGPVAVPAGQLWVMGDNRTASQDSRFYGPISEALVLGVVVSIVHT